MPNPSCKLCITYIKPFRQYLYIFQRRIISLLFLIMKVIGQNLKTLQLLRVLSRITRMLTMSNFIGNKAQPRLEKNIDRKVTLMIISFGTDRSEQTMQTQIRLLGLHCLLFHLYLSKIYFCCEANLLEF